MIDLQQLEADRLAAETDKSDLFDFYHKHWNELSTEIKRLRTSVAEAQEAYINARGFALRDDRPIREGDPYFKGHEEAYSLFRVEPMDRLHVYAGCHEWAVEQAYNELRAI